MNTVLFEVSPWHTVHDEVTLATVTVVTGGGTEVQDWERTGVPVQPEGDDVATVLACVLLDWQVPQAEYVKEVQALVRGT